MARNNVSTRSPSLRNGASATAVRVRTFRQGCRTGSQTPVHHRQGLQDRRLHLRRSIKVGELDENSRSVALIAAGGQGQAVEQLFGRQAARLHSREGGPILLRSMRLLAAALVGGAVRDRANHELDVKPRGGELAGQLVEQLGMSGQRCARPIRPRDRRSPVRKSLPTNDSRRRGRSTGCLRRRDPIGQRLARLGRRRPVRRRAVEKSRRHDAVGSRDRQFATLDLLGRCGHRVVRAQPLHSGKEPGELPELILFPIGKRMVVALSTLEIHAQEDPRGC